MPDKKTFQNTFQALRETGSVPKANSEREKFNNAQDVVLNAAANNPKTSVRRISTEVGISSAQVWRILHHDGLYPYHLQKVQHLKPQDFPIRLQFCNWLLDNVGILSNIIFTDEASFTRDGINNTRNSHSWAHENPHEVIEHNFQNRFSVNVWAGILGGKLFGPKFLENRLTGEAYKHFLEDEIYNLIVEDVPLINRRNLWYQHDGLDLMPRSWCVTVLMICFLTTGLGEEVL